MNEGVFQCFQTDLMNKYIFPVQQKISGNFPENFLEIFRTIFFQKSYITTWQSYHEVLLYRGNFQSRTTVMPECVIKPCIKKAPAYYTNHTVHWVYNTLPIPSTQHTSYQAR